MKAVAFLCVLTFFASGCSLFQPPLNFTHTCKQMVKKIKPFDNVVLVVAIKNDANGKQEAVSLGSGVVIGENGTIATVAHQIFENPAEKKVYSGGIFVNFTENGILVKKPARLKNFSIQNDAAILQIDHQFKKSAELEYGELNPGDCVSVAGYNHFSSKMTRMYANYMGAIKIRVKNYGMRLKKVYILSAQTVRGMSGGPAFNAEGKVIGLICSSLTAPRADGGTENVTGIVPAEHIRELLK